MLYFVRRISEGIEKSYLTENRAIVSKLGSRTITEIHEGISLKDIAARVLFDEPKIHTTQDSRFPETLISEDIYLLDQYLKESEKILSLDKYNPERVKWEEQRRVRLSRLDVMAQNKK